MAGDIYDEILDDVERQATAPAAPQRDVYDDILDAQEREARGALSTSLGQALRESPDAAAQRLRAADELGVGAQFIRDAETGALAARMMKQRQLEAQLTDTPVTARALRDDPDFAAAVHDDVGVLATIERTVDKFVRRPFQRGEDINSIGAIGFESMWGELPGERMAELARLQRRQREQLTPDDGLFGYVVGSTAEVIGQMVEPAGDAVKLGMGASMLAGGVALAGGITAPAAPAAALGGFAAGVTSALAASTFKTEAGSAYLEFTALRDYAGQPLDADAARGAALAVGAVNAAVELGGLKLAADATGLSGLFARFTADELKAQMLARPTLRRALATFGKRVAAGTAIEVGTEVMQEIVTLLGAAAVRDREEDATPEPTWSSIADRLGQIAMKTAAGTVLLAGGASAPGLMVDAVRAQQAAQNREFLTALGDSAAASKTRERLPERLQRHLETVTADGPVQTAYIAAQPLVELFQSLKPDDPIGAIGEALPSADRQQVEAALASNGTVAVPLSEFATRLAGTEAYTRLADDVKFRADGFTAREAQAWEANHAADAERQAAMLEQDAQEAAAQAAGSERVVSETRAALEAAGVAPDVATGYSELHGAFYSTMAQRAGVDVGGFFDRYRPTIVSDVQQRAARTDVTRLDLMLDDLRAGRRARERDLFGPTLLEHLAEAGGIADVGGELAARDLQSWHRGKPFARRVVRNDGADLEAAARRAIDAGYLTEADADAATSLENLLLEAIDRELSGQPVRSAKHRDEARIDADAELDDLALYLESQGVDLATTDNATIKRHFAELAQRPEFDDDARTLMQSYLQEGARGSITLPTDFPNAAAVINLFRGHDLSTFLHESGHLFLEVLRDVATREDAPADLAADYDAVLQWLGARRGETLTTAQHEQFARGFEAYLFEGKAPAVDLDTIFARFRSWLVSLYRKVSRLNVELTDDVRAVFDRMLASEDAIAAAEAQAQVAPLFGMGDLETLRQLGVTDRQVEQYRATTQRAHDEAVARLEAKMLADMRRQKSAEVKAARAELTAAITKELQASPVYQALEFLRFGRTFDGPLPQGVPAMKLDRQAIVDSMGEAALARLPGSGASGVYRREGGVHPSVVAELFGFESGDALLLALMNAEPIAEAVTAEVDRRVREQFGDVLTDGTLEAAAVSAIHNDSRMEQLAAEFLMLSQRTSAVSPALEAKRIARETIARTPVSQATPGRYLVIELRAQRAVERALAAGDFKAAAEQKRVQLLNHALAREALQAKEAVDAGLRHVAKFDRPGTRKSIDPEYLVQIDSLLERYDFRRAVSLRQVARRQSLLEWANEQEAKGLEPAVSPAALNEARRQSYKTLSVEEFNGLIDSIKSIEHLGRLKHKLLVARDQADFLTTTNELITAAQTHPDRKAVPPPFARSVIDDYRSAGAAFLAEHLKPELAFEYLDGHKPGGPWWSTLFKPLADAEAVEGRMMREATAGLLNLFKPYTRLERAMWYRHKKYFPSLGVSLNKAEQLALALNWGNDQNRERVLMGYNWTAPQVQPVLDALDARDWQFVQGVWNLLESFWPQIAELQKRLTGVEPPKVEASPVFTRHGVFPGGYYPIKYDSRQSEVAHRLEEKQSVREAFGGNWARAQTRKGHTEARVSEVRRPVLLNLSVFTTHIENVIHDLTHREAVLDVDRILQDDRVEGAIKEVLGVEFYRLLRPWLMNIAADRREPVSTIERILSGARHGTSVAAMGLKLSTMLLQPLGFSQSVELLGERYALKGLRAFYRKPWQLEKRIEFVLKRSEFMRNRMSNFDRDVRDATKRVGVRSIMREFDQAMFAGIGFMDMAVSLPTWLGAYEKGMADFGNDEAKAIDYADRTVRLSQGSGAPKDLAAVQHGSELKKLFTMFYSYFSTLHNLTRRRAQLTRSAADAPRAALSVLYLFFVPAVLSELMLGRGPDDDEGWLAWAAKKTAAYPLLSMVLLRDVAGAVSSGYGYQLSPVADVFQHVVRATSKAADGDFDEAFAKSLVTAAGVKFALPTRQAWLTGEYMSDYFGGGVDHFSLYEALVTGDRDR